MLCVISASATRSMPGRLLKRYLCMDDDEHPLCRRRRAPGCASAVRGWVSHLQVSLSYCAVASGLPQLACALCAGLGLTCLP